MPATVLITGASSGIGAALAQHYARDGARLGLVARRAGHLARIEAECRRLGAADVRCAALDVRDRAALGDWIRRLDGEWPIDLAIANAGVLTGTPHDGSLEPVEDGYRLLEINVLGVANTVHPLLGPFAARGRGQIALVSSLAGLGPMPDMPSYGASKAAVLSYGLALREAMRPHGVRVNVICPGFVTTDMTEQVTGNKLFEMPMERAIPIIVRGLARNRPVVAFPFTTFALARINGVLPEFLRRAFGGAFHYRVEPQRSPAPLRK